MAQRTQTKNRESYQLEKLKYTNQAREHPLS